MTEETNQQQEEDDEPWPWYNKAGRSDYNPPPFYYWDDQIPDCPRLVAWSQDCRQMRAVMMVLLETFSAQVNVLLKCRPANLETRDYSRWHGEQSLANVKQALDEFPYYVFKCGYEVLCLLDRETDEYMALDEYGLLWFYTRSQEHSRVLEEYGFQHSQTPLVTEGGCFVATEPDQESWRQAFIDRLGLEVCV